MPCEKKNYNNTQTRVGIHRKIFHDYTEINSFIQESKVKQRKHYGCLNKDEDLLSKEKLQVNILPCLHSIYLRQVCSKLFVASPTAQLRPMFRSSVPLKTWKTLRFMTFSGIREKNIDSKRAIYITAKKLYQAGQKATKYWYKIFLPKLTLRF